MIIIAITTITTIDLYPKYTERENQRRRKEGREKKKEG